MKITRKLSLAMVAVLATGIVLASSYVVGAAVTATGFQGASHKAPWTKGHRDASANNVDNSQCLLCHQTSIPGSTVEDGDTATSPELAAHARHFASLFLKFGSVEGAGGNKVGCITCHPDTNTSNYLRVGGAAANTPMSYEGDVSHVFTATATNDETQKLRRNVNPAFCNTCHGQRNNTGHAGGNLVGCSTCHTDLNHSVDAGVDYINSYFADTSIDGDSNIYQSDSRCLRCHGALSWFQTDEANSADAAASQP